MSDNLSTTDRAWIELNMSNLENNINEFKSIIPKTTEIMAVVKANAYGHGAIPISKFLNSIGITNFAVATLQEGIELRKSGITGNILILGYTDISEIEYVIKYNLIQTIIDFPYAQKINSLKLESKVNVHLKINTGLNRIGENYNNTNNFIKMFNMSNLSILGCFSHLGVADSLDFDDVEFTKKQISNFDYCINKLKDAGYNPGKLHIQNTYGTLNYSNLRYDYVRIGIGMYGIFNNISHKNNSKIPINLKPVLSLKSHISSIHKIHKNDSVSYGRKYVATKDTTIATVAIGYADGYPRALSNKNINVLVNNNFAKIIGTICMDQLIIDISNIPNASVGNVVTLVGDIDDISVETISYKSNSISNELLCRFGSRLPRLICKNRRCIK